jgi:hypothetical protein
MRITYPQEEQLYYALWEGERYRRRKTISSAAVLYQKLSGIPKGLDLDEL